MNSCVELPRSCYGAVGFACRAELQRRTILSGDPLCRLECRVTIVVPFHSNACYCGTSTARTLGIVEQVPSMCTTAILHTPKTWTHTCIRRNSLSSLFAWQHSSKWQPVSSVRVDRMIEVSGERGGKKNKHHLQRPLTRQQRHQQ